jgi:hypothetical protein
MPLATPQAAARFDPAAGLYGFPVRLPGKRPHYAMEIFATAEDARNWLDPHREGTWDDGGEMRVIATSRTYKPASDPRRLNREGE